MGIVIRTILSNLNNLRVSNTIRQIQKYNIVNQTHKKKRFIIKKKR